MNQDDLPPITVTEEMLDQHQLPNPCTITDLIDSEWSRLTRQFYQERIAINRSNNTLHLRFVYDYEIDLDQITKPLDLLHWAAHLCQKTWMTADRVGRFIEAVCEHKAWNLWGQRPTIDVAPVAGVYFLHRKEQIIYIGESQNIQQRTQQHSEAGVHFDKVSITEIANTKKRKETERELIRLHRPKLNKRF